MGLLKKVITELEKPREARPFGSGWLSGSLALLAAQLFRRPEWRASIRRAVRADRRT